MTNNGLVKYLKSDGIILVPAAIAVLIGVIIWVFVYSNVSFNFNVIWLETCAKRIIQGGHMQDSCFETNPPLSIMLYMPLTFAQKFFPAIDLPTLFIGYVLGIVILASMLVFIILRKIPFVDARGAFIFTLFFILANTLLTGRFFGERDHFVFIGVMLFMLIQYCITLRIHLQPLLYSFALIFAGICILIKPHYGLIVVLMIIDRIGQWKNWRALFQPDTLIMAMLCIVYGIVIALYFPDYATVILPQAASLYASVGFHEEFFIPFLKYLACLAFVWWAMLRVAPHDEQHFLHRLFGLAAVAIVIFYLQRKGWGYHLIPYFGAFFCATFFCLYRLLLTIDFPATIKRNIMVFVLVLVSTILAYFINPISKEAPDQKAFTQYNLARIIQNKPQGEKCNFMIFAGMREIQSLAHYNNCNLSSRFAVIWFFSLAQKYDAAQSEEEKTIALNRLEIFSDMIAEDIVKNKPHVIITRRPNDVFFATLFKSSDKLRTAWSNYSFVETVDHETPDYFAGSIYSDKTPKEGYNIFKRNDLLDTYSAENQ